MQVEELHESEKAALRAAERELVSLKEKIFKQSEVPHLPHISPCLP